MKKLERKYLGKVNHGDMYGAKTYKLLRAPYAGSSASGRLSNSTSYFIVFSYTGLIVFECYEHF